MTEFKITITAADIAAAINNLAAALNVSNDKTVEKTAAQPAISAPSVQQTVAPTTPVAANPTITVPVHGVPLSAAPAQPVPPATNVPTTVPTVPTPVIPTAAPTYTLDMIANAGTALIDAGKMDQLMQLLRKYGIDALTSLPPEMYGNFANDLRGLGAQI